jgi:hypothetical protein
MFLHFLSPKFEQYKGQGEKSDVKLKWSLNDQKLKWIWMIKIKKNVQWCDNFFLHWNGLAWEGKFPLVLPAIRLCHTDEN